MMLKKLRQYMDNLMYTDSTTQELLSNNNDFEERIFYDKNVR